MRLRSLSVTVLAATLLVPAGATSAAASGTAAAPTVSAVSETFKSSASKRAKRAARTAVAAPVVTAPPAPATYADEVLRLTNAERASRGLRALALSPCADGYADSWALSLASLGSLSHQALSPILSGCGARSVGENVAYGSVTPAQLVQMWMDSAGHRANILNASFTHLGVGAVTTSSGRTYGVQVFLSL